jgi:hypothetical protein
MWPPRPVERSRLRLPPHRAGRQFAGALAGLGRDGVDAPAASNTSLPTRSPYHPRLFVGARRDRRRLRAQEARHSHRLRDPRLLEDAAVGSGADTEDSLLYHATRKPGEGKIVRKARLDGEIVLGFFGSF